MSEQCEVCGRERMTWVHSSSLGPFSIASCRECLNNIAEPEYAFAVTMEETGGDVAPHVRECRTWKDGAYVTWDAWASAREQSA
jgi:hypothetical protein